jgi:glycosyltransferase involved in cell wall biosynthesis
MGPRSWSGAIHSMFMAIEKKWGSVTYLGPNASGHDLFGKTCNVLSRALFHKQYNYRHCIAKSIRFGGILNRKLAHEQFDCIVAPAASTEIACLQTNIPIIYIIDATFSLVVDYYSEYSGLSAVSIKEGNWIERAALKKSSVIICTSQWARQSAMDSYGIDEAKLSIIPFGANIENIPSAEEIKAKKNSGRCQLLFLGVDWERKGGSIAFDTLCELDKIGVAAELVVCGCTPPAHYTHKAMRIIPFLDKTAAADMKKLYELFSLTDFLLLPTRAEGFGIVFCEANAFGVPAITSDTGGVSGAVTNGENGYRLPLSATGAEYARLIADIYLDDHRYKKLSQTSREKFEKQLNWDAWATSLREIIAEKLGK